MVVRQLLAELLQCLIDQPERASALSRTSLAPYPCKNSPLALKRRCISGLIDLDMEAREQRFFFAREHNSKSREILEKSWNLLEEQVPIPHPAPTDGNLSLATKQG